MGVVSGICWVLVCQSAVNTEEETMNDIILTDDNNESRFLTDTKLTTLCRVFFTVCLSQSVLSKKI